jgi:hypothetical protein
MYPRPQLRRRTWESLDGSWRFCFDDAGAWRRPDEVPEWPLTINVPFAPESALSGIGDSGFHAFCWYEREFDAGVQEGERLMLNFGAVDYATKVWLNDQYLGEHIGGHTPFSFDITPALRREGRQKLTVRVADDPHDLAKPRGKQDWQREPHSIWYPRTTGIWQTVWLESVPATHISRIRWTPHLERWEIGFEAFLAGPHPEGTRIQLRLSVGDQILVDDSYRTILGEVHRRIALSDPGIDDFRNELLWSPEKPTLIRAEVELWRGERLVDTVESYTALRSVSVQKGDFMLNGRPYYLRMVLDQGYWPDSLMTAPSSEALRRDIELTKAMGFNGVRKHQKIEDPRYLYWADKLGLLVWEEMPSAYRFTHESVERITREWIEVIDRDYSHPCIVVWVPFNESWGVPDLAEKEAHRSCVQALYHLTKTLGGGRPVIGNDGWENSATDIIGIHDYDNHAGRLRERYSPSVPVAEILNRRSPAGRMLTVEGYAHANQPIMLTEFGGIAFVDHERETVSGAWGYGASADVPTFRRQYRALLKAVQELKLFRGFCYTQLTDTFQEANGLLYADRTPKLSLAEIHAVTRGHGHERVEVEVDGDHDEPYLRAVGREREGLTS